MTQQEIKENAPSGATHYMDDDYGFDYVYVDNGVMSVWFGRFSCWIHVGVILLDDRFKPL